MSGLVMTPMEERELLLILERYLPELRREIADTKRREFRLALKDREAFMEGLILRLRAEAA